MVVCGGFGLFCSCSGSTCRCFRSFYGFFDRFRSFYGFFDRFQNLYSLLDCFRNLCGILGCIRAVFGILDRSCIAFGFRDDCARSLEWGLGLFIRIGAAGGENGLTFGVCQVDDGSICGLLALASASRKKDGCCGDSCDSCDKNLLSHGFPPEKR